MAGFMRLYKDKGKGYQLRAMKAQWEDRGIAIPTHNLGTRRGWVSQHHAPAALPPGKRPGTNCTFPAIKIHIFNALYKSMRLLDIHFILS
jgi:hypothetical protein